MIDTMQNEIETQILALQEQDKGKTIIIVGGSSVSALAIFAACKQAIKFACCNVSIERETKALQKEIEATRGIVLSEMTLLYVPPTAKKPLPTYKQDRSMKYYNRFLK